MKVTTGDRESVEAEVLELPDRPEVARIINELASLLPVQEVIVEEGVISVVLKGVRLVAVKFYSNQTGPYIRVHAPLLRMVDAEVCPNVNTGAEARDAICLGAANIFEQLSEMVMTDLDTLGVS